MSELDEKLNEKREFSRLDILWAITSAGEKVDKESGFSEEESKIFCDLLTDLTDYIMDDLFREENRMVKSTVWWHDAKKEKPTENGKYLVIIGYMDGEPQITDMSYFNGWNKTSDDSSTEIKVVNECGQYIHFWAKMAVDKDVLKAMFEMCKE